MLGDMNDIEDASTGTVCMQILRAWRVSPSRLRHGVRSMCNAMEPRHKMMTTQ